MICSLQELGIESKLVAQEYAEGIFVFPNDAETGNDALAALQLDDAILELGLTPNRADAMNMLGVAYEVAAILDTEVKLPQTDYPVASEQASDYIAVKVEDQEANPLYTAKIIKNVTIAPSPLWMQTKLMNAGIRPHNNVVDITNFVLLEYGQPLHAFDYDRFGSKEVVVRKATENETILTLDDQNVSCLPITLLLRTERKRKPLPVSWEEQSQRFRKIRKRFCLRCVLQRTDGSQGFQRSWFEK